jgi:hypothetical protein
LPNPVTPVLGLLVVVGVEVEVMEDDCVGGCQVDAKSSGLGGEDEDEDAVVGVVLVNQNLTFLYWGGPVQSEVLVTPDPQVLLHDVQHHGELSEDQNPVVFLLHSGQQVIQDGKLAAVTDLVVAQTVVLDARIGETRLVDVEVGHDGQVLLYELYGSVPVRVVLFEESGQSFDLPVVKVSPDEEGVVGDLAEVHQHPDPAVSAARAFEGAFGELE